ncbi:MAG TPA: NAD-dependent epimerase/dehydratase family protein [Devosia sp.]|nr:NAD-dependent epimerase/dehydratase family protein [Devosia sp.]
MKILVTGGSGFLGTRLIAQLLASGHEVLALARSTASQHKLAAMGASPVPGDLEGERLDLPPVDAVVHAAAHFHFAGPRAQYFRTNVDGTKALLAAADKAGAKTFIYVSAAGVIMDDRGSPVCGADESAPTQRGSFSPYLASKAQAEAAVLAANRPGFRTVALRPPGIWGPGDMWSRDLPRAIAAGQFGFIDRGDYAYSTCHVDNVIEAIGCALERGTGGRAYFINDRETLTFRDFVRIVASVENLSIDRLPSMPYGVAFFVGWLLEGVWTMARRAGDPPLSRSMVRMIGREFATSDAAARRELGYEGKTLLADGSLRYRATDPASA